MSMPPRPYPILASAHIYPRAPPPLPYNSAAAFPPLPYTPYNSAASQQSGRGGHWDGGFNQGRGGFDQGRGGFDQGRGGFDQGRGRRGVGR